MVDVSPIPPNWKINGVSITVDPSQAGTPTNQKFALLAGHKTAAGSAPLDQPVACGTQADADALFGPGSMLARMFSVFFAINRSNPLFAVATPEPSGTAATGTITVAQEPSVAGVIALYIAGQRITVPVSGSDNTSNVAIRIRDAINFNTSLPVTASATGAVLTMTVKWKGASGNDVRVLDSYRGFYGGEALPDGLSLTYANGGVFSGGSGTPDFSDTIASLGDTAYKFVAMPFTDTGSRSIWSTEYGFGDGGRWGWLRQSYGQVWSARRDNYANLVAFGQTANDATLYTMAVEPLSPSPVWVWSAVYAARAAQGFTADPGRPLQTLTLDGALPAPRGTRFNKTQLNGLAQVGFSIQGTDYDGQNTGVPQIIREQSGYQRNTLGLADNAYELATTISTLDEIQTRLRQALTSKFPRHKLANDGTRYGAGQAIVTPKVIKGEIVAQLRLMEYDGLVENVSQSKKYLVVERSSTEANTVEVLFPPDLINGLRRLNIKNQFRLQFPLDLAA